MSSGQPRNPGERNRRQQPHEEEKQRPVDQHLVPVVQTNDSNETDKDPHESPSPRQLSNASRRGGNSPHLSEAKRPRSVERAPNCPDRADKENTKLLQVAGVGSRRCYGDLADAGGSLFAASPQMWPTPWPRKSSEGGKTLQLHCSKAQTASRGLQLIPAIRPLDSDGDGKDPLHIGLPNCENSCYQNATLQSLLGLRPS
ncbi:hypothetical protein FJT64_009923 [Amphibalanus amphitrite]|uniref:Uncharacterized protein n=1 Tax=Amphibalanus amphitrite TaxID=1232801 RepID=A0A6A4VMR5_AMPAM|nr:hypothetical protein FJT64_009923 [Amphibalanus amphitrite]